MVGVLFPLLLMETESMVVSILCMIREGYLSNSINLHVQ